MSSSGTAMPCLLRHLAVEVLEDDRLRDLLGVVRQRGQPAEAHVLRHEPDAVASSAGSSSRRRGGTASCRRSNVLLPRSAAEVVVARQPRVDHVGRGVHVLLPADHLRRLRAVAHVVEPLRRLEDRLHHLLQVVASLVGELRVHHERLLGMVLPERLRGDEGEADPLLRRDAAPRLADVVAVHVARLHVRDHLRRRDRLDLRALGIDAGRRRA